MSLSCSSVQVVPMTTSLALQPSLLADEQEFVRRLQSGDVEALSRVYREHQRVLCSFAARLLSDPIAAEDLVHDVFAMLPSVIHRYQPDASLRGFLLGIASRRAKHHLRSARRRRGLLERFAQLPRFTAHATPEEDASKRSMVNALTRALDRLSFEHRLVFTMCDIEEMSPEEAAQVLAIPGGTVRSRLFHARKQVRRELSRRGVDYGH